MDIKNTTNNITSNIKQYLPAKKEGTPSSWKVVLLFTLLAWMQFIVFFSNIGPLTAPDPEMTLAGSYALATGQSFTAPDSEGGGDSVKLDGYILATHPQKINLPENLIYRASIYNKLGATSYLTGTITYESDGKTLHTGNVVPTDSLLEDQMVWLSDSEMSNNIENVYTRANQYNPICFIPTAIGMKLAMIVNSNSWGLLQSARIFNFLFYFALSVLAICIIPRGKGIMATVAVLPTSIFCASALAMDSILISVCMVYIAYFVKVFDKGAPISIRQTVLISCLTLLVLLLKAPYGALALIYLALPKKIWPTKQKAIAACATLVCFAILYGVWFANFQMAYVHPALDYNEQVAYVTSHLFKVVFSSFVNFVYFLCLVIPTYFTYMLIPIAIAVLITCSIKGQRRTPKYMLVTALISALIVGTFIFVFLQLTWCPSSDGIANLYGFQDRYLLPLLPLLALLAKKNVHAAVQPHHD